MQDLKNLISNEHTNATESLDELKDKIFDENSKI